MKKGIEFLSGLLTGLFVSALILMGAIFTWQALAVTSMPSPMPLPASQSPADLQSQVDDLARRVDKLENDQSFSLREIAWKMDQKLYVLGGIALVITSLAAFFGWKTYKDLDATIREKIRLSLENELYQLDPANLTIRLPKGHPDTPLIRKRLELSGLHNIKEYLELNKQCLHGLTIVPVNNAEEEERFRAFLKRDQPDPELAAFVLYTTADPREFRVSVPDTLNQYERVAIANMPATVITAVLAISRGLHKEK